MPAGPFRMYISMLLLVLFSSVCSCYAQSEEDAKRLKEVYKEIRRIYSTSRNSSEIRRLLDEAREIKSRSKSYIGFAIGYEISRPSLDALNNDLLAKGFPALKNNFGAIGFGYSRMNKRITGNLLFNVVPGNKVNNADYEISLRGAGATFDKGYAFVSTQKMILHAFAGIGWQYHTIKQTQKNSTPVAQPLYTMNPGDHTAKITQESYHGSLGVQYDLNAYYKKTSNTGLQTAIRFAWNPILFKSKYKYGDDNSVYRPKVGWREFNISFLVKIFSKTYFLR